MQTSSNIERRPRAAEPSAQSSPPSCKHTRCAQPRRVLLPGRRFRYAVPFLTHTLTGQWSVLLLVSNSRLLLPPSAKSLAWPSAAAAGNAARLLDYPAGSNMARPCGQRARLAMPNPTLNPSGARAWSALSTTKRARSASCCATCFASTALVNCAPRTGARQRPRRLSRPHGGPATALLARMQRPGTAWHCCSSAPHTDQAAALLERCTCFKQTPQSSC